MRLFIMTLLVVISLVMVTTVHATESGTDNTEENSTELAATGSDKNIECVETQQILDTTILLDAAYQTKNAEQVAQLEAMIADLKVAEQECLEEIAVAESLSDIEPAAGSPSNPGQFGTQFLSSSPQENPNQLSAN